MQETILGIDRETGSQVTIDTQLRQRSMYVVGIQGGGKSSFLQTLIHQDIVSGSSVIVIDPHEDLLYDVIAQLPEDKLGKTYLLDLSDRAFPFGLNIFSCANYRDDEQRDITRNRVAHMFERIWPETIGGRYFGTLLENVIDTLIETPGATMADIPALLQDETRRSQFISHLQNREVKDYWMQDYNKKSASVQQKERDPLVSRVRELLRQTTIKNVICQKKTTFDFRTAIEHNEIILINLPLRAPAYEKSAPVMGIMLLSEICRAVFSFATIRDMTKRPRFSLYVDEYQNFTTSDFSRLFTEGRKFGIRTTVAHQERSQLDDTNRNASTTAFTKVAFQTTAKDAAELVDYFRAKDTWVRPKNVYSDVLHHLKDHPNAEVAAFFATYIAPLQQVAKEKVKHYRDEGDVYPKLTIGDKTFSVDPETVTGQLERFRERLYGVSCGEKFVWPNYSKIATWWDFRLAYKKYYRSQPAVEAIDIGWKLECHEVAFDSNENYFVSLLRQYGGISTWIPFPKDNATLYALADEKLGKEWFEKTDLLTLLEEIPHTREKLASLVYHRYQQNTPKDTFFEAYRTGKLSLEKVQALLTQTGEAVSWEKIEALAKTLCQTKRDRYKNTASYLDYVKAVYKTQLESTWPQPPNTPSKQTVRFLWFTYERWSTSTEESLWKEKEYERRMQETFSVSSKEPDLPATITAPFSEWKKAYEEDFLSFLVAYTSPDYFLHRRLHVDWCLIFFRLEWSAYTQNIITWTKKDIEKTCTLITTDLDKITASLEIKREEIQKRLDGRLALEEKRHEHFYTLLSATAKELKVRPLGELKTPSSTEAKENLLSLKPRQAYVRIGTAVHTIQTLTVPDKVVKNELARRVSSIREHTHQKYSQKRSDVEVAFSQEGQEETKSPPEKNKKQKRIFMPYEELDEE